MKLLRIITGVVTGLVALPAVAQDTVETQVAQARANEQRVRDTLRTTTQQLRATEAEKASLLAGQSERDQKIVELEARLAAVTKQSAQDKQDADSRISALTTASQRQAEQLSRLNATLAKWKSAHAQAATLLKQGEATRSRLQAANVSLERSVADRGRQNLELYKTGAEILQRYADFSLGRALAAREPFTGIARARLEEQIEDYADRLQDGKLKPIPSNGRRSTTPAPAEPPQRTSTPSRPAPTTKPNP